MKFIIKFIGGFRDGTTLVGSTEQNSSAAGYPFLTDGGTIGRQVSEMPTETMEALHRLIMSEDQSEAYKKGADELIARFKDSDLTEEQKIKMVENLTRENQSEFPSSSEWVSRLSEFKNEIYEITSREIQGDSIYATASFIGEENCPSN